MLVACCLLVSKAAREKLKYALHVPFCIAPPSHCVLWNRRSGGGPQLAAPAAREVPPSKSAQHTCGTRSHRSQAFQAVHRTRPPPRTTPGGDQVMRAKPSAAPHVPIGKAVGKAGLVLPEDVLLVIQITRPPRLLAATMWCRSHHLHRLRRLCRQRRLCRLQRLRRLLRPLRPHRLHRRHRLRRLR